MRYKLSYRSYKSIYNCLLGPNCRALSSFQVCPWGDATGCCCSSGWWLSLPLWKIRKSVGMFLPNIWKTNIHVPNHQPVFFWILLLVSSPALSSPWVTFTLRTRSVRYFFSFGVIQCSSFSSYSDMCPLFLKLADQGAHCWSSKQLPWWSPAALHTWICPPHTPALCLSGKSLVQPLILQRFPWPPASFSSLDENLLDSHQMHLEL